MTLDFTTIVTAIGEMLLSLFTNLSAIFYTPATGDTQGQLTFIGWIAFFVLIVNIAIRLVNWIRSLIARR